MQILYVLLSNKKTKNEKVKKCLSFICTFRWALVKDKEVAKKMTKFIELNTIGVSKDSQLRAAKILSAVSDSCEQENSKENESFFKFSHKVMANRWKQLREVVHHSELFSLSQFSPAFCNFFNRVLEPQPGIILYYTIL